MVVIVACKNKKDSIKNEADRMFTKFPHYKSMGIFLDAQGQISPKSEIGSG